MGYDTTLSRDSSEREPLPMKNSAVLVIPVLIFFLALFALVSPAIRASDHADPMSYQTDPNGNITDLFFYPKGDQMILIFNVYPKLTAPKPYDLEPFEYAVHMDLTSPVKFDKEDDRARYGGTVVNPERLHPDVNITIRLNNDATLKDKSFQGLKDPDRIRIFTGVRDDPFIFPRFFKTNVVAMVMSIPMPAFPEGQRDWILWGTTHRDGKQIDHVGRSNRSQQARFDSLNTLPPSEHVPEIMRLMTTWDDRYKFLSGFKEPLPRMAAGLIQYVQQIRKYDVVPDVMIYTNRFPPGFPNGRLLADDVAAQTCQMGDCILQDTSFIEGGWPRQTVNDKPFLDDWPYLAEPWPDRPQQPPPAKSIWPWIFGLLAVNLIVSWSVIEVPRRLLVRWYHRRSRVSS
jgi:hypothetical protein